MGAELGRSDELLSPEFMGKELLLNAACWLIMYLYVINMIGHGMRAKKKEK